MIGQDAALEAAKKTQSNKAYGFGKQFDNTKIYLYLIYLYHMLSILYTVPSENKKDVRSIEQTMADIQAKKRLKTTHICRPIEDIIATNTTASLKPSIILPTAVNESSVSTDVKEGASVSIAFISGSPESIAAVESSENTTEDV